jgi:hypothetical protein
MPDTSIAIAEPRTEERSTRVAVLSGSDVLFCVSLANLLTLLFWSQLFRLADPSLDYYRSQPVDLKLYLYGSVQAIVVLSLLTGLFVVVLRVVRRAQNRVLDAVIRAAVCVSLIVPLHVLLRTLDAPEAAFRATATAIVTLALLLLPETRFGRRTTAFGTVAIAVLWPFAIMLPGALLWRVATRAPREAFSGTAATSFLPYKPDNQRVICIVFDELSDELLFRLYPDRVRTPEFHRLRSEALHADDALPTSEWTRSALPALTMGRAVSDALPTGPNGLQLRYPDERTADWSQAPHLFRMARGLGLNVGVVGWYHPYCRLFPNLLSGCATEVNVDAHTSLRREFVFRNAPLAFLRVGSYSLAGVFGQPRNVAGEYRVVAVEQRAQVQRLVKAASDFVADPRFGLLLVHLPVPHLPVATPDGTGNYFDNLNEADAVLGQLRHKLERAGMWNSAAVLVTSDHDLRTSVWDSRPMWTREESDFARRRTKLRVPFLLKMPGQTASFPYSRPLNTALTRDLLLEIARGRLKNAQDVAGWMDSWNAGHP